MHTQMARDGGGKGAYSAEYVSAIEEQIAESEDREMQYIYRHNKLQKEYHNLVGVAAGACARVCSTHHTAALSPGEATADPQLSTCAELVEALEETVQGTPPQPDQLEALCSQLLLFSANTDTSLPVRRHCSAGALMSWRWPRQRTNPGARLILTLELRPLTAAHVPDGQQRACARPAPLQHCRGGPRWDT